MSNGIKIRNKILNQWNINTNKILLHTRKSGVGIKQKLLTSLDSKISVNSSNQIKLQYS